MWRGAFCCRAAAKLQCQGCFCSRQSLGSAEVLAGRAVAVQSRDPLLPLPSMPGLQGKDRSHWLGLVTIWGWLGTGGSHLTHLTAQGTFAAEGADLEQGVNVAVLMSDVLSVFTRAENLLSKSKCCAKTESQTVLWIYEPIQQNNVEVTLMGTRKWSLQVWGSQAVQYGLFHVHGSKRGKKDF